MKIFAPALMAWAGETEIDPGGMIIGLRRAVSAFSLAVVVLFGTLAAAAGPPPLPDPHGTPFVLPDGTTFIVGRTSLDSGERFDEAFAVWKRNADGTPDTTFNGEGFAAIPIWGYRESAEGLAVQPDGKIVVAGLAWDPICGYLCEDRTAIVRLNPDGTLDRSFNGDGIIAIVINYVDGGILSAASGTEVSFDPVDVKILPDGTIQVAASVQVHPDGTLKGVVDNYFGHFAARETPLPHVQGSWYAAPPESEAGWGITFSQQGEIVFAGWFTYDAGGRAWWLSMTAVRTGEGIYRGTIIETRGPAFHTQPFDPALVTRKAVGEGTLTFIDRNTGKFAYTIEGVSQTKTITRQVFGPLPACSYGTLRDPANATNFQDMWWAAPAGSESGWGISLAIRATSSSPSGSPTTSTAGRCGYPALPARHRPEPTPARCTEPPARRTTQPHGTRKPSLCRRLAPTRSPL
jgi:uncharacterized delta-60 repeat protein